MQPRLLVPVVVVFLVLSSVLAAPARAQGAYGSVGLMGLVGQDQDADGLIDVVLLSVPVRVEDAGVFTLEVWLPGAPEPLAMTVGLPLGTTLLHPAFSGAAFRDLGTDGPYMLSVDLVDAETGWVMDAKAVTTPAWTASDFDPAGVTVTTLEPPWFLDADHDGLVDTVQVNYTLDVTDAGTYRLWTRLTNATGSVLVADWDRVTLAAGTASGSVRMDARPVILLGSAGPCRVTLSVVATYGFTNVVVSANAVLGSDVGLGYFDPLWAYLLLDVTSEALDEDSDGLFDVFVLHAPVHLDRPATVTVASDLLTEPDEEGAPYAVSPPTALPAGDSVVDLRFSGVGLNWSYVDGPCWGNLTLTVAELPGYQDTMPFSTVPYHWWEMSPISASHTSTTWPEPEDTDSDGLAEWMSMGLAITVAREGDYFLQSSMGTDTRATFASTAQYLHLKPGTTDLTARISGIAGSRMAVATMDSELYRLGALEEPTSEFGMGWGPATDPSVFEGRDLACLNGTVTAASGVVPDALVTAVRPADAFAISVRTNATGAYSLPLYDGAFTVLAESLEDGASTVVNVTLSGDGLRDFVLPAPAQLLSYGVGLTAWDAATVGVGYSYGGASAAARVYADLYRNFDGVANATELGVYARYPTGPTVPSTWPHATPVPPAGGLALRVDGQELVPGPNQVVALMGAGPIDASTPVSLGLSSDLLGPAPAPTATHLVSVALPPAPTGATTLLSLSLPSDVAWSEGNASADATLLRGDPRSWTLQPGDPVNPSPAATSAWIQAWNVDPVPPTAIATGPTTVERTQAATFHSSSSTDNVAITDRTWTVSANGTVVHGYAEAFTWTPTQIGTFDVRVRVRDAAGNWDEDNVTVRVVDTTPPAVPTGLAASLASEGGGTVVHLAWSSVVADDLHAYRVYRSADSGTTFAFLGWSDGTAASFADASASSGGTYLYRVTAVDRYGNEGAPSVAAQAVVPAPGGNPAPLDLGLWIGIGALVVVVGAAGVATYLFLRRRKGQQPPIENGPEP